jgi:hypothetical protein
VLNIVRTKKKKIPQKILKKKKIFYAVFGTIFRITVGSVFKEAIKNFILTFLLKLGRLNI